MEYTGMGKEIQDSLSCSFGLSYRKVDRGNTFYESLFRRKDRKEVIRAVQATLEGKEVVAFYITDPNVTARLIIPTSRIDPFGMTPLITFLVRHSTELKLHVGY